MHQAENPKGEKHKLLPQINADNADPALT